MSYTNKDLLVQYAIKHVGLPYIWGGDDPILGFDCSGWTQEFLAAGGIKLSSDHTADMLYRKFLKEGKPSTGEACALAFYGSVNKVTHVATLVSPELIVEAGGGGSASTSSAAAASLNAYMRMRYVKQRGDLVAIIMPNWPAYIK